jgi:hypothetical protein
VKKFLTTLICLLLFPLSLYAQRDVELISIKLFETGYTPMPRSERYYATSFSSNEARYIDYEIHVRNNLYNIRDNEISIKAKYYHPDGSLMGAPVMSETIPYNWETAYYWKGWGWDEPGNWEEGTYTIELYIDGRYITEKRFTIYSPRDYSGRNAEYEFDEINFLEAGSKLPERDQYRYSTHFKKYNARYIYCEIVVRNNLYEIRSQSHEIVFEYYNPDGSLRGKIEADYNIKAEWKTSWISRGWGWDEPGNWPVGTYDVVVYIDNKYLTEGVFTIYE